MTAPIPVSVIGGFLGAGKTTLLNRLLAEAGGARLGVIVNDFGDINIDERLIVGQDGDMISLANGCICCSIGNDFLKALIALVTRLDPPEQIFIEASGVANPARIAGIARVDRAMSLQGVVVLVDAVSFMKQLGDPLLTDTLEGQVQAADLLIITKSDIADDEDVDKVSQAVRQIAPAARVISTSVSAIPIQLLFDLKGADAAPPPETHDHHHPFWTGTFVSADGCDLTRLRQALGELPDSVLRLKGFVRDGDGQWVAVQWVAGRLNLDPCEVSLSENAKCELVFIGVGEGAEEGDVKRVLARAFGD